MEISLSLPDATSKTSSKITFSLILATFLTGFCYAFSLMVGWLNPADVNTLELFAVWTSFACTYLYNVETRYAHAIGIVSVIALSLLFWQSNLLGSMAQNLYLIPTLMYGWYIWGRDDQTKQIEPVDPKTIPLYIAVTLALYGIILGTVTYLGGSLPYTDSFILIGSLLAQFFLDRKKIVTWKIWAIVNVVAIYTYFNAELYFVTLQFVFFLANTIYANYLWSKSVNKAV